MIRATHQIPELTLIDHEFEVPLDHKNPSGDQISIFARELRPIGSDDAKPFLLFLQGGPGIQSPRVEDFKGKWWERAMVEYRVLLLDQRGTGLSTPVNYQTLAKHRTAQAQADYLKNFRADSIVRDCELIRKELAGGRQWSVLGQSYGGFCIATYLSFAPDGLREAIITGGIPPIHRTIDEVYRATYKRTLEKNRQYFERYPDDAKLAREIVDYLNSHDVHFPNGDPFRAERFQQIGIHFGMSNGFEMVHYLLETAFVSGAHGLEISYSFLRAFENSLNYDTNPIYAVLHEPIYCEGQSSNWSADRILSEFPEFRVDQAGDVLFVGEMIYPWMFDEYTPLQPLKQAAHILAEHSGWPPLYDRDRLRKNKVPVAAVIYYGDMYVERAFAEESASSIAGMKLWVTSEFEHNGLRADGVRVLDRLLKMLHGEI